MSPDEAIANIFLTPEGLEDPSPFYKQLRDTAPVHRSGSGVIFLSRFEDCREALRDNRLGKSDQGRALLPGADPEATAVRQEQLAQARASKQAASMLFLNPPHHTRQRALVSRAFTPRRVEALRSSITDLAQQMTAEFVESGGGDLLEAIAFPLPVAVIGTMVGVPAQDWPQFRDLITTSAGGIEPNATADDLRAAAQSGAEVRAYFHDLLRDRQESPKDDLLSDLAKVKDETGDALTNEEIVAVSVLLFAAGFETTTNLIGNTMGSLLRHSDQMQALWDEPALVTTAVDEALRWDSPVQIDARSALEPAEIAGEQIGEGTRVVTLLGAANRDPAQFDDPDRFDVRRDQGPPMSFASGIHYCLGANLTRAEGQEAFSALIEQCASIELTGALVRRNRLTLRGYERVDVAVTPR